MLIVLAAIPLLLFFALSLIAHRGVLFSAVGSLAATLIVGFFVWRMEAARILAASLQGTLIAAEIILIVFGALLILHSLRQKGLLTSLEGLFQSVSPDPRVQVILIAWGLVYFLEGVAGFGTPALVAIPLLLALGFPPLTAASLALIGDSVPVIFGAIGLPVTHGILATLGGLGLGEGFGQALTLVIALLNFIGSLLIPVILLVVFARLNQKPRRYFLDLVPFALVAGLAAALASLLTAYFIGPELASIIGGLVAIFATVLMAKRGWLVPRTPLSVPIDRWGTIRAITPYASLFFLLALSRLPFLPFRVRLLEWFAVRDLSVLGSALDYTFYPFYSAAVLMLVSALVGFFALRLRLVEVGGVLAAAGRKIFRPLITLAVILAFVQIFIASVDNARGLPSMLLVLADTASAWFGPVWPLLAPVVGALGAFAAGSATISNVIFAGFQYQAALGAGFNPVLILALQGTGAAAGNMIALHNIIAALAVAGLAGKERLLIRRNLPPLIFYLLLLGLFGLLLAFISG